MKILAIHANFIEFQAKKKAFPKAEENISTEEHRINDCLVIFTAVEKRDEADISAIITKYIHEITQIATQLNAQNIVLYPYAHLSNALAAPSIAVDVMQQAQAQLKTDFTVERAPFGWYKSFTINCKGHPLSELSREFGPETKQNLAKEYHDEPFRYDAQQLSPQQKRCYTAAMVAGAAIKRLYKQTEMGSIGFYHDQAYVDVAGIQLRPDNFPKIQRTMQKIITENPPVTEAAHITELTADVLADTKQPHAFTFDTINIAPQFNDPFVTTNTIATFKLLNVASAYWKNNQNNKQLTRLYIVAFTGPQDLEAWEQKQAQAEARSHLRVGKDQGLFVVSPLVGAGLPLLAPNGMIIKNEIVKYLWELHTTKGYQQVGIPHIAKDALYKKSGHWEKFGDELFKVQGAHESFILKPMNCPHHIQIFDAFAWSYRDLPVRYFEPTTVYRDEKPGQLTGLSRVRAITQDDGHVFCRRDQISEEVKTIVGIVVEFYKTMGMTDYWVSLSVRGDDMEKYLGEAAAWDTAEQALESVATANHLNFKKIRGEAAFYGPKLDFMFMDALGREWQLATIQLDFNLPNRFNLQYMNAQSQKEQPVMIHRAISGSLERFMSVLIEHFGGKFPLWLSPLQVKVLTITDEQIPFAKTVVTALKNAGLRVKLDDRSESMGKKIRDAQLEHVPYMVTIGDKEVATNTVALRDRAGKQEFGIGLHEFVERIVIEYKGRVV